MTQSRDGAAPTGVADDDVQVQPIGRVRRIIAERMRASLQGSAQLTSVVEVDLSDVIAKRGAAGEAFRERHGVGLSPLAVVARGVCVVLGDHSLLNAQIDLEAAAVRIFRHVNLGIAIDTEGGLMVPNLRSAEKLSVAGLAKAIGDLAGRARSRKLTMDDLEGGTFTITNTGSRGSLLDTPILNAPEVAILAVGKAERRPVAVTDDQGERVEIRDMAYLCLTYDHRLIDGADAARFLVDLKRWVETADLDPELELQ